MSLTIEQKIATRNYTKTPETSKAQIAYINKQADAEATKRRRAIEDHQARRQLSDWGIG